ncbi:MAG: hypothetical protein M3N93_03165 [Acidobacteriota bacterium]|nr:hypothetical protein [Acidobacteriota bacterium]
MVTAGVKPTLSTSSSPLLRWIRNEDRRHFHAEGYMVIRNVIAPEMAHNAVREIAAFIGADLSDNGT